MDNNTQINNKTNGYNNIYTPQKGNKQQSSSSLIQ